MFRQPKIGIEILWTVVSIQNLEHPLADAFCNGMKLMHCKAKKTQENDFQDYSRTSDVTCGTVSSYFRELAEQCKKQRMQKSVQERAVLVVIALPSRISIVS